MIQEAYGYLIEQEKRQATLSNWAVAVFAADYLNSKVEDGQITPSRYLPFREDKPKLPISREMGRLLLRLINEGKIPAKFVGILGNDIEAIRTE